jgi:FlgD Ig-like domain/Beta-propeller repeat
MRIAIALAAGLILALGVSPSHSATPVHFWSHVFNGDQSDSGYGVCSDAAGNVYMTGSFFNTINFGGGPLTSVNGTDVYVVKFDANGQHVWSRDYGGTNNQFNQGYGIAVDEDGYVYVAGEFQGTVNFGGQAAISNGNDDIFLLKLNSNGGTHYVVSFGGTGQENFGALHYAAGYFYLTGAFVNSVNFGGIALNSAGSTDIFAAKYASFNAAHQWSQRFGSTDTDYGNDITTDTSGNVYLAAYFKGSVSFGGATYNATGFDGVLARYNSAGAFAWSRQIAGTGDETTADVVVLGNSHVYVTGSFSSPTINLGGATFNNAGSADGYLAKYTIGNAHVWSNLLGGTGTDVLSGLAVNASGDAFVGGSFTKVASYGGTPLVSSGNQDAFLVEFDDTGTHMWSRRFGAIALEWMHDIATDPFGAVLFTGNASSPVDFGGGVFNIPLTGNSDTFLAKYGPQHAEPLIQSIEDVGNDQGRQVKITFARSGIDDSRATGEIDHYEVFRRDDPPPSLSAGGDVAAALWQNVGSVRAHGEAFYLAGAPTIGDSTLTDGEYPSVFFIRAVGTDQFEFYDSPPDSGQSLDNLAPGVPLNFVYANGALTWSESDAADFDHFSIYGSEATAFSAGAVLIAQTGATTIDVSVHPFPFYYATATDAAGNESRAARVQTGPGLTPQGYQLAVNACPNPFNPKTTVRYDVPSTGRVVVNIYDASGSRVATLVDSRRDAGSYSVEWEGRDAHGAPVSTGIYFVRVAFGNQTTTRKIALVK